MSRAHGDSQGFSLSNVPRTRKVALTVVPIATKKAGSAAVLDVSTAAKKDRLTGTERREGEMCALPAHLEYSLEVGRLLS